MTYFVFWSEDVEGEDGDQLRQQCEDTRSGPRRKRVTYGNSGHGSDLEGHSPWGEGPLVRVFEDDIW